MPTKRLTSKTWGDRVAERREELELSQAALALLCPPLTQQAISKIENNTVLPRDTTKHLLARSLGTTVDSLFPWADFDITQVRVRKAREAFELQVRQRRTRRSA